MPQTFESKFGFYAFFLTIITLGALAFAYLILALMLVPAFSSSFGQIGNWSALILILSFLGFVFFKFLVFLLAKEVLILNETSIFIQNGKDQKEINYDDINYISEFYQRRSSFIAFNLNNNSYYNIEFNTKFGIFYVPPKIIANINWTNRIRQFLINKKELQNKFHINSFAWKIYKIGGYIAFTVLGLLLTLLISTFVYSKLNNIN